MSTELKTISMKAITKLNMEKSQARLSRSSSLDKIKKYTFVCAQQYYILPALLTWLKNSQSGLQASTESCIYLLRGLILNTFFKIYLTLFRNVRFEFIIKKSTSVVPNFYEIFSNCFEPTCLLKTAVYAACFTVLLQFFYSIYLIYFIFLPHGFIFLVGCMLTIKYLFYKTIFNILTKCKKGDHDHKSL